MPLGYTLAYRVHIPASMNEANLAHLADAMRGDETADWQWIGKWMSQRMFGITEKRAREYAARHGGIASKMER